uniref:RNA-dependent RNA polymerase n=1 Tax=Panagrolaimus davidi TaxID=227884 RepID=A0A914QBW9_9BILA
MVSEFKDELEKEGYMRVRKLIVTPTRRIYVNPESIMGYRSLRKKSAENMLRLVFRDNSNKVSNLPPRIINDCVTNTLKDSIYVALRQFSYLCSSNTQMRDHGCYFLAGTPEYVAKFCLECARFKFTSIVNNKNI